MRVLADKQKQFVDEYFRTGSATEAVYRAGYRNANANVARSHASRLLRNPCVQRAIICRLKTEYESEIERKMTLSPELPGKLFTQLLFKQLSYAEQNPRLAARFLLLAFSIIHADETAHD